ncbi:anthrone oxygenase family protein [Galbibacter sp. PAP.153]|uniref:anthrone oxygenase family protein n=1 Tax=Galbibacter sp. PAP.153 TaxID=3104623 RepID=UPI003008DD8B
MKFNIVIAINLILSMLVTGVFWGTWFTLTRSIDQFSAAEFIHIGKVIIANVANPMKILMPLTILWLIVLTGMKYPTKGKDFYLFFGSLLLMITTLLITLLVEVPIDDEIKTWTVNNIPNNWESIREKWAWYHGLRTVTSIFSFVVLCVGSVLCNKRPV